MLRCRKLKDELAFLTVCSICWLQDKLLLMFTPRYLAQLVGFNWWPWMEYDAWIGIFLLVIVMTSHLSGLRDMSQSLSHCCRLPRSSWSCFVSSMLEMERYIRQSSANILVVEDTAAGKSLMNTRNNRGPSTVPCGTPDVTLAGVDIWPTITTLCVRSLRNASIHCKTCPRMA